MLSNIFQNEENVELCKLSRILTGNVSTMKKRVTHIVWAPTARPFFTQSAWGKISPKITMPADDTTKAT
jgi:hypothetical protein